MSTDRKLVAAATALLDLGGQDAVTLRAVAQATGLSHNAPYKHFASRDALLAAVATEDFAALRAALAGVRVSAQSPANQLMGALRGVLAFNHAHKARYQLLFNTPSVAAAGGQLKQEAMGTFQEFLGIVETCQQAGVLPATPGPTLASLLFATMHGLLTIEATGGLHPEKGLTDVESSLRVLVDLLGTCGFQHRP